MNEEFKNWVNNQEDESVLYREINSQNRLDFSYAGFEGAWNHQQAKIDKLERAIKYLMDNVDIPRYELEFCGLIEKEVE